MHEFLHKRTHEEVYNNNTDPNFQPKRTICLPIGDKSVSHHTINYVIEKIAKKEDLILLMHCRRNTMDEIIFDGWESKIEVQKIDEIIKQESIQLLVKCAKLLEAKGFTVRAVSLKGDARQELEHAINETKVDLVVIGKKGSRKFSRVLIGHVSEYLTRNLEVPIMVLPEFE